MFSLFLGCSSGRKILEEKVGYCMCRVQEMAGILQECDDAKIQGENWGMFYIRVTQTLVKVHPKHSIIAHDYSQ